MLQHLGVLIISSLFASLQHLVLTFICLCFRGVWGWDDSNIFVGNVAKGIGVNQTKGIDVISTKLKRTVKKLQSPLVKDVISRLHCHPLNVGMLAGSTAGGHVYVWTTK